MVDVFDGTAKEKLQQYAARIESLEADKEEIAGQIRDVLKDASNDGFDTKILKTVLKLKKMKREDRIESEELIYIYKIALGFDD